jgi:hypothetical protein
MSEDQQPTDDAEESESREVENNEELSESASMSAEQSTENYIETYHAISEWIRFADAKAGVMLTVGAALAGFLIPTIQAVLKEPAETPHLIPNWAIVCESLFGIYLFFFLLSGISAFLCINPFRKKGKHSSLGFCEHFHPAEISAEYQIGDMEKFLNDCDGLKADEMRREVQAAILVDSHILTKEYGRVKWSIFHFAISV